MRDRGLARFATPHGGRSDVGGADVDAAPDGNVADRDERETPGAGDAAARDGGVAGSHGSAAAVVDGRISPDAAQVLARFARPRRPTSPGEVCEICSVAVAEDHRHVVDLERRGLLCACRGCALLFTGDTAQGRYRTVPDRYLRIAPFALDPQTWAALQIPVGVAFVVRNTQLDRTVAFYPSPGGATESELPLDAWDDVVGTNPGLGDVEPDVEAALIRTDDGDPTCFVVPVDRCYELVGTLRMHWRGFDGGQEVRQHLSEFFADVERRSRPAPNTPTPPTPAPGSGGAAASRQAEVAE